MLNCGGVSEEITVICPQLPTARDRLQIPKLPRGSNRAWSYDQREWAERSIVSKVVWGNCDSPLLPQPVDAIINPTNPRLLSDEVFLALDSPWNRMQRGQPASQPTVSDRDRFRGQIRLPHHFLLIPPAPSAPCCTCLMIMWICRYNPELSPGNS